MTPAAISLRVSTRHQAEDGFSLDHQRTHQPRTHQRRVYELLDLHINVTPERTYAISGTIPTHGPLTGECEVSTGVPRDS